MRPAAIIGLLLVMTLVSLSSYLRLDQSGIGCTPLPDYYGNIGQQEQKSGLKSAYERLVAEARQPMSWARPMHRLIASTIGLLVLGLVGLSLQRKKKRAISFVLLGLTVFLAWLGIYSEGLHSPAVVMGNLGGGFAMLGVFGLLVFEKNGEAVKHRRNLRIWVAVAIAVLCLQIFLGGLTAANFAVSTCQMLDMLHRIIAVLTVAVVLITGIQAIRAGQALRPIGIFVCLVVFAELLIGIAAIQSNVTIGIAVSHNWLAGLLLLGLLRIRAS
jgi:cytochrome c oxidase assembly protein subunit 15